MIVDNEAGSPAVHFFPVFFAPEDAVPAVRARPSTRASRLVSRNGFNCKTGAVVSCKCDIVWACVDSGRVGRAGSSRSERRQKDSRYSQVRRTRLD